MQKLFDLLKELMGYLSSGKVTESNIETFVAQFREKGDEPVKKVTEKATKFLKPVTLDLPARNLKTFFKTGEGIWCECVKFDEVLAEVIETSAEVSAEKVTRFLHKISNNDTHDDVIDTSVNDRILDATNAEDVAEAKTRLNILATVIETQAGGKIGDFESCGNASIMFRIRLKSGRVVAVHGNWFADARKWVCSGWNPNTWEVGLMRLSSNGES